MTHPEEVLILSIEDDTTAEDTAELIRDSGLIREVYRGPAKPPWPTLRELIERDERVLVLVENDPGDEPWMHKQSEVAQETPYHFGTAAELAAAVELPAQPRRHRGLAVARQPLGRHVARAAPVDRARGQRPRLPRAAGSPAAAPSAGCSRTSSPSTSTARATCSAPWIESLPTDDRGRRGPGASGRRSWPRRWW